MEVRKKRKQKKETSLQTPDGIQRVFDMHRKGSSLKEFLHAQNNLVMRSIALAILSIIVAYLFLPISKVQSVQVTGTRYLSDAYIKEISGIQEYGLYYLNIPFLKNKKLESDPLIQSAHVKLGANHSVQIQIEEEKVIGYRYEENGEILLGSGKTAPLKSEYLDIISEVPLVSGFNSEEQQRLFAQALAEVSPEIIESISEITRYPLEYDQDCMKILMRNGGYFVGSYYNLSALNYYYDMYMRVKDKTKCISALDHSDYGFTMACPWESTSTSIEYWTDEVGNVVTNSYGDKVAKHYYIDAEGNQALDGAGNPIVIPIDEFGNEVRDELFDEHYAEGKYATGIYAE